MASRDHQGSEINARCHQVLPHWTSLKQSNFGVVVDPRPWRGLSTRGLEMRITTRIIALICLVTLSAQ